MSKKDEKTIVGICVVWSIIKCSFEMQWPVSNKAAILRIVYFLLKPSFSELYHYFNPCFIVHDLRFCVRTCWDTKILFLFNFVYGSAPLLYFSCLLIDFSISFHLTQWDSQTLRIFLSFLPRSVSSYFICSTSCA